jgi:hypothetical protein
MVLWTDIVDPATLSGYARASLADYEQRRGTLARWLPNRDVADIVARFVAGSTGLIDVAKFRAYDAEPEVGNRPGRKRVTLELPALGQTQPVTEYDQLRQRTANPSDEAVLDAIETATDAAVRSVADAIERLRGIVLYTGKATIDQDNFKADDDFGRPAGHTVTAPALWSVAGTDALGQLEAWADTYRDANGEDPGAIVMSTRALRAFAGLDQMKTQLLNGASRPANFEDVQRTVEAAGLPPITRYDRRVSVGGASTKVIPDDRVLLLPAPVETDDWQGTELGATFWGRTLSSTEASWEIPDGEQPGLVVGVYRNPKPPMQAEVISDAIALPVLANAALSFAADVL